MSGLFVGGGFNLLITQLIGVGVIAGYTVVTGLIMWTAIKALGILRIPADAEKIGIDAYEHGQSNWPDVLPIPENVGHSAAVGD